MLSLTLLLSTADSSAATAVRCFRCSKCMEEILFLVCFLNSLWKVQRTNWNFVPALSSA